MRYKKGRELATEHNKEQEVKAGLGKRCEVRIEDSVLERRMSVE